MNDVNSLAETLARTGLASSPSEAKRKAQSIMKTESKVAHNFDTKNQKYDKKLRTEKKKSYREEIDDLIQKTSMENKKYHIPIKGYTRDKGEETIKKRHEVKQYSENAEPSMQEMLDRTSMENKDYHIPIKDYNKEREKKEDIEVKEVEKPSVQEKEEKREKVELKPVYTDVLDDERSLNEIMNEQAGEFYGENEVGGQEIEKSIPGSREPEEFSSKKEEAKAVFEEKSEPDQVLKDQPEKEDSAMRQTREKEEVKKKLPEVDLADYFKFG